MTEREKKNSNLEWLVDSKDEVKGKQRPGHKKKSTDYARAVLTLS